MIELEKLGASTETFTELKQRLIDCVLGEGATTDVMQSVGKATSAARKLKSIFAASRQSSRSIK